MPPVYFGNYDGGVAACACVVKFFERARDGGTVGITAALGNVDELVAACHVGRGADTHFGI